MLILYVLDGVLDAGGETRRVRLVAVEGSECDAMQ